MFVQNLLGPLTYNLQVHCCATFMDLVEKGVHLKKALIAKGELKYNNKNANPNLPNDKNKYWVKKKHITNDGIVDAKVVNTTCPTITLRGTQPQNTPLITPMPTTNSIQKYQDQGQPCQTRQFPKRCTYTPMGEPIELVLKKLLQKNIITLSDPKPYEPG